MGRHGRRLHGRKIAGNPAIGQELPYCRDLQFLQLNLQVLAMNDRQQLVIEQTGLIV